MAWVWGLATLSRGITLKAAGWLQKAYSSDQAAWDTAVQALGADGRFPVDYMTEQRERMREAREERERLARNGGGFDATLTPVQAWDHVATSIVDEDMAREVAKAVSNAMVSDSSLSQFASQFISCAISGSAQPVASKLSSFAPLTTALLASS